MFTARLQSHAGRSLECYSWLDIASSRRTVRSPAVTGSSATVTCSLASRLTIIVGSAEGSPNGSSQMEATVSMSVSASGRTISSVWSVPRALATSAACGA